LSHHRQQAALIDHQFNLLVHPSGAQSSCARETEPSDALCQQSAAIRATRRPRLGGAAAVTAVDGDKVRHPVEGNVRDQVVSID
jgi:hypothetical protein